MQLMTVAAFPFTGVMIEHLLPAGEFILVTAGTDFNLVNRRQTLILSRVGIVTVKTEICSVISQAQMGVRFEKTVQHRFMTFETEINSLIPAPVTGAALTLTERSMLNRPQESRLIPAVRIMAT